jgi:hypothetical protein
VRNEHVLRVGQKLFKIQSILLGTQPKHIVVGCAAKIWKIEFDLFATQSILIG